MKSKLLNILKYLFTLAIAFGLLWYAFRDVSITNMIQQLGEVKFGWIYISIFLSIISHLLRAYRWKILLKPLHYSVPLSTSFWSVMIGYLANLAFPRMGEITKCGVIKKTNGVKMSASMGTVVTERIFDVLVLLLAILLTFVIEFDRLNQFFINLFSEKLSPSYLIIIVKGAMILGFVLIIFTILLYRFRSSIVRSLVYQKLKESIISFKEGILSVKNIDNVPGFILSTLGIWVLYYFMSYLIVFSIPETSNLDWIAGMAILVVGGIAMSAPVQGGIGTYHFLVSALLTLYAIPSESGVFFATLLHTSQTLSVMLFGSLGLIVISFSKEKAPSIDTTQNGNP